MKWEYLGNIYIVVTRVRVYTRQTALGKLWKEATRW